MTKNLLESANVIEILSFGVIGLGFLLALFAYRLLVKEQRKSNPDAKILSSVNKFMVFAVVLSVVGLISEFTIGKSLASGIDASGQCIVSKERSDFIPAITEIDISGEWESVLLDTNGQPILATKGKASITQPPGCPFLRIQGEVPRPDGKGYEKLFWTEMAYLDGSELKITYRHKAGDRGIGEAFIAKNAPGKFILRFFDVYGSSADIHQSAEIEFSRP